MKKLTKIGVSALAGSLAAASAVNAAEMSVAGGAKLTYTSEDVKNQTTGNNFGMANTLLFSATGDVNGYDVTYRTTLADDGADWSSSQISIDMGDMGAIAFDQGVGGNGLDAFDDMTPTAYEESNDGMTGGLNYAGDESTNVFKYTNTIAGFSVNAMYDPARGDSDTIDESFSGTGVSGNSTSIAVGLPSVVDGLAAGVAYGEDGVADGTTTSTDIESIIGFAKYAMGPITVGYQMAETSGGTAGATMKAIEGYGIVFNVNENLSVSYNQLDQEFKNTGGTADVTEESTGIAVAYTMGSASIAIQNNEQDNAAGATGATANEERTEIALALSF